jgi:hypothetical protein
MHVCHLDTTSIYLLRGEVLANGGVGQQAHPVVFAQNLSCSRMQFVRAAWCSMRKARRRIHVCHIEEEDTCVRRGEGCMRKGGVVCDAQGGSARLRGIK